MININHVTLVGRLTRDIEIRKTNSNVSWCNFSLAVDRRFSSNQDNQNQADFINCVAWRQSADFLGNYASKGTIVAVEGRIQTRNYDGPNGKVYVTEVVAESVQIISNRTGNNAGTGNYQSEAPKQTFTPSVEPAYDSLDDDFSNTPSLDISSDDLPFY